jgi:sialic acid synthase SpsE
MIINKINTDDKVFIIAEVGNNHEGSYSLAEELVGLAAETGVDAVKFQTFQTEYYVNQDDQNRFQMLKSFELKFEQFEKLAKLATKYNLSFMSTPFDINSAIFLSEIVDAIKIGSGENTFYPLIESVAQSGKPIIISTGMLNMNDINKAITVITEIWDQKNINGELGILHCVSSYPVKPKHANLMAIKTLIDSFDHTIGYSDHTLGMNAAIASVGLGARIIEKHFTVDKKFSDFRDHQLSSDPKEMKKMVNTIREIENMFGTGEKTTQESEKNSSVLMRRSIVAKNNLIKGHTLSSKDITWVRPGGGLSPGSESEIVGRKVHKDIDKGEKILLEHLD